MKKSANLPGVLIAMLFGTAATFGGPRRLPRENRRIRNSEHCPCGAIDEYRQRIRYGRCCGSPEAIKARQAASAANPV